MTKHILLALVCALLMAGCAKDKPEEEFIRLCAEGFTPGANSQKAAVSGRYTYWVDGDNVLINLRSYDVSISSDNEAVARRVTIDPSNIYRAVYPSSVFDHKSGDIYTINVPRRYYYYEVDGKQVLEDLPMVAYYEGDSDPKALEFKHITAAITVRVKNEKPYPLTIDRIVLKNSHYQLGGPVSFDISTVASDGFDVTPYKLDAEDSVAIHFVGVGDERVIIKSGDYKDIQIPILPVGEDKSSFTIQVFSRHEGGRYEYNRATDYRNNSIGRACIGYAVSRFDADVDAKDLYDQTTIKGKNYYEITCPDELVSMSEAMDNRWRNVSDDSPYLAGNYVVTEDIDLNGRRFVPIHYYNETGGDRCTFDGLDHTIKNFVVSSEGENEPNLCGLFGKTGGDNITIMNLNVEDGKYEFAHTTENLPGSTNPCTAVGGIIAYIDHDGIVIENCNVRNIVIEATNDYNGSSQVDMYTSGIVGYVSKPCTIRGCSIGEVIFNNTNETHPNLLVDQFGAAIGRLDVENHTYFLWRKDKKDSTVLNPNVYTVTIEDVHYDQGVNQMNFKAGLKNIRYGGLIANITEGGIVVIKNCTVKHNCVVHQPSTKNNMYMGGFIGWIRSSHVCALELHAEGCSISGTIENATNSQNYVNPYVGAAQTRPRSLLDNTCENTLKAVGTTSGFKNSSQKLSSI